jgi:hypothetical protein
MKRVLSIAAAVPLMAVAVAGCGSDKKSESANETTTNTTATAAEKTGAPGAKAEFVTPKEGGTSSDTVKVKVKLTGFELAPKEVGKTPKQGQGHLHFSLDGGKFDHPKYSGANGQLAVKLGVDGKYSPSVTPTITYKGIPKGKHEIEVYLANNDHSDTGVEAKTEFTVQ